MGSAVNIEFKFPDLEKKFREAREEINLFIAANMQTNRGMLFDQEGAYNGHEPWAPLKLRVGHILKLSGTLSRSMGPKNASGRAGPSGIVRFSGDVITIGTELSYARLMNDGTAKLPGGVLRPTGGAEALAIPLPNGKKASDLAKSLRSQSSGKNDLHKKITWMQVRISELKKSNTAQARKAIAQYQEKLARYEAADENSPKNQRVIFRKSVKIPARPFDTWTDEDQAELETALVNKLAEILNR